MAIKKVRIKPPGYTDIVHPETSADIVKFSDDSTVEAHKAEFDEHLAENASQDNVHGLRGAKLSLGMLSQAGSSAVAVGAIAQAGSGSVAVGASAQAGSSAVAVGASANASANYAMAIGISAKALATNTVSLGYNASSQGSGSIALGYQSNSNNIGSIAIGQSSEATGLYSTAIGRNIVAENNVEGVLGGVSPGRTQNWKVPGNFTVEGTKNFEMPHPKPSKKATHRIRHGAVESPTAGDTLYRFKVQSTKDNDLQTIDLPDYFIYLNKDVQIFVTPQGHFGNGYGVLNEETEQLEIHCQFEGEYNVLVIGTRNDNHQSVQDWNIKGVEREVGESWTGETYTFSVDEIMEVEEIKEVV